jgi:hypothetical protein
LLQFPFWSISHNHPIADNSVLQILINCYIIRK